MSQTPPGESDNPQPMCDPREFLDVCFAEAAEIARLAERGELEFEDITHKLD